GAPSSLLYLLMPPRGQTIDTIWGGRSEITTVRRCRSRRGGRGGGVCEGGGARSGRRWGSPRPRRAALMKTIGDQPPRVLPSGLAVPAAARLPPRRLLRQIRRGDDRRHLSVPVLFIELPRRQRRLQPRHEGIRPVLRQLDRFVCHCGSSSSDEMV